MLIVSPIWGSTSTLPVRRMKNGAGYREDLRLSDNIHEQLLFAIAATIRERRDSLRMSQNQLAEASGLNRSYIGDFERGGRSISIKNLNKLAFALGTRSSVLMTAAEQKLNGEMAG